MGLRQSLQDSVAAAFDDDLADAVQSFTIKRAASSVYDTLLGENVITYITADSRGVFDKFTKSELVYDGVKPEDFKLIVLQNEMSISPEIDDLIVESLNIYKIISFKKDPANVAWEIQCRA